MQMESLEEIVEQFWKLAQQQSHNTRYQSLGSVYIIIQHK